MLKKTQRFWVTPDDVTIDEITIACGLDIDGIQLRCRGQRESQIEPLVAKSCQLTKESGLKLFLNSFISLSCKYAVDSVHLPERLLQPCVYPFSASVHSVEAAKKSELLGAVFLIFGPIYHTKSKTPAGEDALLAVIKATTLPVYAIGGICPMKQERLMGLGAAGVFMQNYINQQVRKCSISS